MIALHNNEYCKKEIEVIIHWIKAHQSGVIMGINGVGKSNFFQYLTQQQQTLYERYKEQFNLSPFIIIPLDLNYIPDERSSTLPRMILRAFYEVKEQLEYNLQKAIQQIYKEHFFQEDSLISWAGVKDTLSCFKHQNHRVIFLLDRFEEFPNFATIQMLNNLRGLRDNFKRTLTYLVSMGDDDSYQTDPTMLGEFHELIDINYLWLKPLVRRDALYVIKKHVNHSDSQPTLQEIKNILKLSGNYPALLVAICRWWCRQESYLNIAQWEEELLQESSIISRLVLIWDSLTRQQVQCLQDHYNKNQSIKLSVIRQLCEMGIMKKNNGSYKITGELIKRFILDKEIRQIPLLTSKIISNDTSHTTTPRVKMDNKKLQFFIGDKLLVLTELESRLLELFLNHPKEKLNKSFIIMNVWPNSAVLNNNGISDENLQQLVRSLRVKLKFHNENFDYIATIRTSKYGDGGYVFNPEGNPRAK